MKPLTVGSLFSGVGGLDLGLERAGMEVRWQCEIDPFCQKVLEKHWPHVKRYGDITKLDGDELEPVDLIAGGFPCQDVSQAGKRAGIEGTRSGLWFEYARLLGVLRPRWVLIENVPGLLDRRAMPRVIGELARLGYVGIWRSLRASDFGAAHLRKRVFIVAHGERSRRDRSEGQGLRVDGPPLQAARPLFDGGQVADPGFIGAGRTTQPAGVNRRRASGNNHGTSGALADSRDGLISQPRRGSQGRDGIGSTGAELLPDASQPGLSDAEQEAIQRPRRGIKGGAAPELCGPFAPGPADPRWPGILESRPDLAPALEPPVRGMADGVPYYLERALSNRTKRLSRLGNAVVPQVAEWIGRRIVEAHRKMSGETA